MSEFENAIPKEEQELKDRTDAAISQVAKLGEKDLGQVAGGDECVDKSKYGCAYVECDTGGKFDCPSGYYYCERVGS